MRTAPRENEKQAPPQLVGILADAVAIGATAFRLEPNPPHTMASLAAGSQAAEIDFESWSGREMLDFLPPPFPGPFVSSIDKMIDQVVLSIPNADQISAAVLSSPFPGHTVNLEWRREASGGSW